MGTKKCVIESGKYDITIWKDAEITVSIFERCGDTRRYLISGEFQRSGLLIPVREKEKISPYTAEEKFLFWTNVKVMVEEALKWEECWQIEE